MITFSKLEKIGRIGNQLFQIASTVGIAKKNNHSWFFPKWKYRDYFDYEFPEGDAGPGFVTLKEKEYRYHKWDIGNGNYDLYGWLQSERYFDKQLTKEIFSFKPSFERSVLKENARLFTRKTILISIRRGDFVDHPLYFQLSFKYYFLAMIQNFPDWKERNIIFTSDDIQYCRYHFGHLKNAFFLADKPPIEYLLIGTHCDDFVISNSTFSWWIAWLGEKNGSKVICPVKNFNEERTQKDDCDYYPDRWIKFDHRNRRIPIKFIYLIAKGNMSLLKAFLLKKWRRLRQRLSKQWISLAK